MKKEQLTFNLEETAKKIKNVISTWDPKLFGGLEIDLIDIDYSETQSILFMLIFQLKFTLNIDGFDEFSRTCIEIKEKLHFILPKFNINNEGNLQAPNIKGGIKPYEEAFISEIKGNDRNNEYYFELDILFSF